MWINGHKDGLGTTWTYFDDAASDDFSYTNWVDGGFDVSIFFFFFFFLNGLLSSSHNIT